MEKITALVEQLTEAPQLGVFGEPRVNVRPLNRALDALKCVLVKLLRRESGR